MTGPVEAASALAITLAITVALFVVPLPRAKPPEPKAPPVEAAPVVIPLSPPKQVRLEVIESRVARIQEKVRKLEMDVDVKGNN